MTPPTATAGPDAVADRPAPAILREKPVFAAESDARPRALKVAGRAAAGLVGLWLVALVLGAFGFGHVPGLQLPRIGGDDSGSKTASDAARRASAHAGNGAAGVTIRSRPDARVPSRTRAAGPSPASRSGAATGGHRNGSSRSGSRTGQGTSGSTQDGTGGGSATVAPTTPASTAPPATAPTA